MDFGVRGIGGKIKLFPPPTYHGELDKWDDWSWQLKRYVGLYKPLAKTLMDEIMVNAQKVVTDGLYEAYDVQQTSSQNNQLSLFAKQLAYMLAQITDGLMELRERLLGMKTQRMAFRFGVDCTTSSHWLRELVRRIS